MRRANFGGKFFFLPACLLALVGASTKSLVGVSTSHLIDLGAYEVGTFFFFRRTSLVLWSLVLVNNELYFFFAPLFSLSPVSWERLYRNAWWLERELGEAFNLFFKKKHDRRSLFLMPLLYQAPLRKVFPVGGFFELTLSQINRTLVWRHLS